MNEVPRSRAFASDFIFPAYNGQLERRDRYWVVRTPSNAGFYWGNFLLFDAPPTGDDLLAWPATFQREFPSAHHYAFGWDAIDSESHGAAAHFVERGYAFSCDYVMVNKRPLESTLPVGVEVRRLRTTRDWDAMVQLNIACDELDGRGGAYAEFKRQLRNRYCAMVWQGRGVWLGAFVQGKLVGQLGLFFQRQIGRFQSVETHPAYRRRGVAEALVRRAAQLGISQYGMHELVIVAKPEESAHRIYTRCGFDILERQYGLQLTRG